MRKILPYILGLAIAAVPVSAQQSGSVSVESGTSAPWYNVRGPRISGSQESPAGTFSVVYVPLGEEIGDKTHDFSLSWKPQKIGPVEVEPVADISSWRGNGGGLTLGAGNDIAAISGRFKVFDSGVKYGEVKIFSRHVGLSYGRISEEEKAENYGYVSANWGTWDDNLALGVDAKNTLWNNFSIERERASIFSMSYYSPVSSYFGTESFFGFGNIDRSWFSPSADRFVPRQNIDPKERSYILTFPSYLSFGKWSGEFRAERMDIASFVNFSAGRAFTKSSGIMKGAKVAVGLGPEYTEKGGRPVWKMNKEIYAGIHAGGFTLSFQARLRDNEGGIQASVKKEF